MNPISDKKTKNKKKKKKEEKSMDNDQKTEGHSSQCKKEQLGS
jgi:hypothetical protein